VPHSTLTPADAEVIAKPVRSFIAQSVIPLEQEAFAAGVDDKLRVHLQQLAAEAGLLAPQAPAEYGGGADFLTSAVLLEEAVTARWYAATYARASR
jgi:alkylation response protein AidB-like acyl-CoA dehydrogenase